MCNRYLKLLPFTLLVIATPATAQNVAEGESDYWRTTDVDYSVFKKDQPINNKGLFEVDKKTGEETQISKDFKKGVEIYQQAKPVIDLVGGVFGIGKHFSFLKHIDNNLEYGEWLFGKVPRQQQENGVTVDGAPIGDVYGVDGQIDPAKVREQIASVVLASVPDPTGPLGLSGYAYQTLVGDLAVTRAQRKNLEVLFGEDGQTFAKEARDFVANVIRTSGEMVDQAHEANSTQDVEKIRAQIEANGQLLGQFQFSEQQQTRFSVNRVHDTTLANLEINQKKDWKDEIERTAQNLSLANAQNLVFSVAQSGQQTDPVNPNLQTAQTQQAPPFVANNR